MHGHNKQAAMLWANCEGMDDELNDNNERINRYVIWPVDDSSMKGVCEWTSE